jgi:glycosyltransferase involved in cell wall biosynthesis
VTELISVVVPVYNEDEAIITCLDQLVGAITSPFEILVVFDSVDDTTRVPAEKYALDDPRIVPTLNTYGRGPFRYRRGARRRRGRNDGRRLRRREPG